MTRMLVKLTAAATLALGVSVAHASSITSATIYANVPSPSDASAPGNFVSSLANGTFTVGAAGIDFNADGSPGQSTIAEFLNNPVFLTSNNGFSALDTAQNMELVITGFITLVNGANSFVVGHDDGAVLNIAGFGNVVYAPDPTYFSTSPFTVINPGATGDFAFTLEYVECCGFPADLDFAIGAATVGTSPVPEPNTIVLFGFGMLAFAGAVHHRFLNASRISE